MFRDGARLALGIAAVWLSLPSVAKAQAAHESKQEQRRRELQELLGIKRPSENEAPLDAGLAAETSSALPDAGSPLSGKSPSAAPSTRPRAPSYAEETRTVLELNCGGCHRVGAKGGLSDFVLVGEANADYASTRRFVNLAAPTRSPLLTKARGEAVHSGGKVLATESPGYATLLRWIEGGASFGFAPVAPTQASRPAATPHATSSPAATAPLAPQQVSPTPLETDDTSPVRFAPRLHALLSSACAECHAEGKAAASSRYLTNPASQKHFEAARTLVQPGSPTNSLLYLRARGDAHPPGAVWPAGSSELALLAGWIDGGALGSEGDNPSLPQAAAAPSSSAPQASAPGPSTGTGAHGGLSLGTLPVLGSFRLNARFDLNYERLGYNNNPFSAEAQNALRSYHHFLFLTRQSAEDPFTFTVELLTLQFWEVGYRISREGSPVRISAKVGKLLVPFGSEPLFHHSYGGLAGFDQRVLPPVLAREGAAVNVERRWGALALSGDAYLIAGYALKRADGVLSLQSDFAPLEETRPGVGARLGAAWGPFCLWYSAYFNALGFGRRLFLQAIDLAIWRPRGIKVLEDFSFGAGVLRADVSGGKEQGYGGSGADYYHFASYFQLRYYPRDWLYLQYRQGLRTFNNRRGVILDETKLTVDDGSAHNLGVVVRWGGFSAGLYHYWNLEKADELPNDFTRLMVAYEL